MQAMDRTVILAANRRARCAVEMPAKPVDGAYHLGGIGGQRGNINNFLLGHLWGVNRI